MPDVFDIVMPLYDKAKFVDAAIEAVLGQSLREWRLFVVDDGSKDGGAGLVERFSDLRITLIRQHNQGVGPARNTGIRYGSNRWIAFLDADDVWNADHLQELDALRSEFPGAVLIGCGFQRFSGEGQPKLSLGRAGKRRLARYFAECARGRELFVTSSAAVRRSALEDVGMFEPLPGNEDVELWTRLALHGPVAVADRKTVHYRVDTGGITDKGMGERKPAPKPMKREELSSAIPTLSRQLPLVTDVGLRKDIVEYMDSRVGLSLVAAVRAGDMAYARHLLSLYEGQLFGQARTAAFIARLPGPLGRLVVDLGLGLRRLLRRR